MKNFFSSIISLVCIAACISGCISLCRCASLNDSSVYDIMDYGAVGDGATNDAFSIQEAIDACASNGGGTVLVRSGYTFLCGPIHLKSNVNLHLQPNSRILASPDEELYKDSAFGANEGEGMMWISAKDAENISITGQGCIDGNSVAFMGKELDDSYELKPVTTFDPRPHVLTLTGVNKLTIRDVTIGNSAYWTIHLIGCNDATISGVSVLNNIKVRNSDGIDVDHSRNVRISDCHIISGDDCICLKNRREFEQYGPCRDIVVNNCTMTSRSCAIKIGSENMDSIDNVLFSNCIICNSNRGIGIQNRDEGTVTNVVFSNMIVDCRFFSDVWWGKSEPIYVTSFPRAVGNHKDAGWRFPKGATEGRCGEVSNIWFKGIRCTSENGVFVSGDTPDKVNHIFFDDVDIDFEKITNYPGKVYDRRPCVGDGFIYDDTYAFYIDTASDIYLQDCSYAAGDSTDVAGLVKSKDASTYVSNSERVKIR